MKYSKSKGVNTNYINIKFGKHLKELREKKGISQKELGDLLGLKPSAVSNYESGRNQPGFEKLHILSQIFNVSIDELLCNDSYKYKEKISKSSKEIISGLNNYQTEILIDIFHVLQNNGLI